MVTLSTFKFVSDSHMNWMNLFNLFLESDPTAVTVAGSIFPKIFSGYNTYLVQQNHEVRVLKHDKMLV